MLPAHLVAKGRLESLDVFRGATIAAMILVNNAGSFATAYPPLLHADWHGWTFTDMVYPSFLWIVGLAMTLSFAKRIERGESRAALLRHTLRRSAIIFGLGLLLNGFPMYNLATLRIPGVLQRIAVCYLAAAVIFLFTGVRGQIAALVALLAGYWALMTLVPVPGHGAGVLTKEGNFAQWVDSQVLSGHMWSHTKTWDPEGIVSTLPAIGTVLFGVLAGHLLRSSSGGGKKAGKLIALGAVLALAGQVMDPWMPINKNLWTTSFAVFMAGMSSMIFGACYWLVDVKGWRRWGKPFSIFGMNAIAVYVLAGMIEETFALIKIPVTGDHPSLSRFIYARVFGRLVDPYNASLAFGVLMVAILFVFAYAMYRRRWFLKV